MKSFFPFRSRGRIPSYIVFVFIITFGILVLVVGKLFLEIGFYQELPGVPGGMDHSEAKEKPRFTSPIF